MNHRKKVMVAMSGGIDSSVAAALLKKEGYEVVGVTMCLGLKEPEDGKVRCCGPLAIEHARKVCQALNINHYVMDFSEELEKFIISKFVSEYLNGRTPNPCVECNRYLKFGKLLEHALSLGFDYLSTGHYAKVTVSNGKHLITKPADLIRDQSYFLYRIYPSSLKYILFPLAELTKEKVTNIARELNLPTLDRPSQDLCFIPDGDYRRFITERCGKKEKGLFYSTDGTILGEHDGIFSYTVGQRRGLGLNTGKPMYVISIDANRNRVIVGEREKLKSTGLIAKDLNLFVNELPKKCKAKIRYSHKEAPCEVALKGDTLIVKFEQPQEAITPGQSVVLYQDDVLLGGGVIYEASL